MKGIPDSIALIDQPVIIVNKVRAKMQIRKTSIVLIDRVIIFIFKTIHSIFNISFKG